jgi:hypothetical protein
MILYSNIYEELVTFLQFTHSDFTSLSPTPTYELLDVESCWNDVIYKGFPSGLFHRGFYLNISLDPSAFTFWGARVWLPHPT